MRAQPSLLFLDCNKTDIVDIQLLLALQAFSIVNSSPISRHVHQSINLNSEGTN